MELHELRNRWNEVLDAILEQDRVTWLAFFDARLSSFDGHTLLLDFSDARKFSGGHEFSVTRNIQKELLKKTIFEVLGLEIEIVEK
jgi:hypothetical protein